jgi:PUA domain protein
MELVDRIYKLNEKPFLIVIDEKNQKMIPHLKFLMSITDLSKFKCVTVDMGAIKFVVSGADIMRPGIRKIDDGFSKEEFVIVIDETHKKPLSVGVALFSSDEMRSMTSGKVVKNVHYVGDEFWKSG